MAQSAHASSADRSSSAAGGSSRRRGKSGQPDQDASPAARSNGAARQSSAATSRSTLQRWKTRAAERTWSVPLALLIAFAALYAVNPTESNPVHGFIFLSYRLAPTEVGAKPLYGKGLWDVAFVLFYTVFLSFTREFVMQELLRPLARVSGIRSCGKQSRFMEQVYTGIYMGISGPAGLWVMRQTPVWYFNTQGMYESFPHRSHEAEFKFYYLFQAAYWAQQALVMLLGQEKPRKDYKELVAHHIVTLALIGLSYRFHFTYMGIAVYITHDISDFFLALSKSFHYIDSELVVPTYATLVGVWIYTRHYLNLRILYSLFTDFQTVGPYELHWETQQYKCWISNIITFALLALLQSLNLFWLYCLLRSAWKLLAYGVKKDDRSEDESEPEIANDQQNQRTTESINGNGARK